MSRLILKNSPVALNFGVVGYGKEPGKISMILPVPPSSNRLYRRGRYGQTYKARHATEYQESVKLALMAKGWRPKDMFTGSVRLTMLWYRTRKQGDTSNRIKVLEDALQGVAYRDDSSVVELHLYRVESAPARVEITVEAA